MNDSNKIQTLIVGGGIGGLATALALAQSGRTVHVLERAPQFSEVGAGLQLAPNASRMLERLGVLDAVWQSAVFPRQLVWMDAMSGRRLTALDLGASFRQAYGYPYLVMHRSDLLAALLAACQRDARITLETSRDVVAVQDLGDGAEVRCADGSVYRCQALIGADGLHSTVRSMIADDGAPVCSEYVAYRGTLPMENMPEHAGLDNVVMWTGHDMHLVQYPVRRGELYNQVAVFRSYRFDPSTDDWGTVDELEARFANACAPVRDAIGLIHTNRRWPMYDRDPIADWTRNHIALLGDAAHPMLQYLAQGAAQAIEDAGTLADALSRHACDVPGGLLAYQEARRLRTARVQLTARWFGDFIHLGHMGAEVRNALLSARADDSFAPVDWLYAPRAVATGAAMAGRA